MQERLRPITYAENLEAKRYAEENDKQVVEPKPALPEGERPTSVNNLILKNLPSGGKSYDSNAEIYFSPLTFGEMKFLSVSTMTDVETINFFLTKIHTTFPTEELTYFDFYYITTMVKLATFGELEYTMSFECSGCGALQKAPFTIEDLIFEDIRVPLPIIVDLNEPFKSSSSDYEASNIKFMPITIGGFRKMIQAGKREDLDLYMANCIQGGSEADRLEIIKEVMNGVSVNLLETIDVSLFHGVQNLHFNCKNRINTTEEKGSGEVCGRLHDIPFQDIIEYIGSTDRTKDSLRERIHFGLQDEHGTV